MAVRLKECFQGTLTEAEKHLLVGAYDVVGDIAIIIVPPGLREKEVQIAEVIMANNHKIKVVAKRDGNYSGEFRTIPLKILAGENRKETEVREFGIRMRLNPETVYYSVRSGNERRRIANNIDAGEAVLVLFSGIGPYPFVISRFSQAGYIVGIEKNPQAHRYAVENLKLNRKIRNVRLQLGGAQEILATEKQYVYDRVVMPLPTKAEFFLQEALRVLKPGGHIHYYALQRPEFFNQVVDDFSETCRSLGRQVDSPSIIRCGHCAPRTYRICLDARIF